MQDLPKPKEIAEHLIESFNVNSPPKKLSEYIKTTLRDLYPSLHSDQVIDYITVLKKGVDRQIDKYIKRYHERGLKPKFYRSYSDPERIIGRCFILKTDPPTIVAEKKRLIFFDEIRNCLFTDLSDDDFLKLCACYLKMELGVQRVQITDHPRDHWIDLFGRLEDNTPVIGQVKHSRSLLAISEDLLATFIGKIIDTPWGIKRKLLFFFTSARFSLDADKYAERQSIKCVDGEMLAYFTVKHHLGFKELKGEPQFTLKMIKKQLTKNTV